jgi:ectoine hydroxylase-related dioxygenase (phytanoyl-CoA dioxygenase family)
MPFKNLINKLRKILPQAAKTYGGYLNFLKFLLREWFYFGFYSVLALLKNYKKETEFVSLSQRVERVANIEVLENERRLHNFKKSLLASKNKISNKNRGYVFYIPDYVATSAGIKCMYEICHELNTMGYPSYVTNSGRAGDDLINPIIDLKTAKELVRDHNFIAFYSETVGGNPLKASTVARFVANKPGLLGGDLTYQDDELIFYYSDAYRASIKNNVVGKLYKPMIDQTLFFDDGRAFETRELECFYVGKSSYKSGYFDLNKTLEITRTYPNRGLLGQILRNSQVLYCFDNSTSLAYEAVMCGCPVVIIPDGTVEWQDYLNYELGCEGIQWGLDNFVAKAPRNELLNQRYQQAQNSYHEQLKSFIEVTQQKKRPSYEISQVKSSQSTTQTLNDLSSEQILTPAMVNFFHTFGYLKIPGFFKAEISSISQEFDRMMSERFKRAYDNRKWFWPQMLEDSELLSNLLAQQKITSLMTQLLGENFVYKGSDGNVFSGSSGWHRDYLIRTKSCKVLIYLDHNDANSGALRVIPGTQFVDDAYSTLLGSALSWPEPAPEGGFDEKNIFANGHNPTTMGGNKILPQVIIESSPGDIIVFNHNIIHCTNYILRQKKRRLLGLHFTKYTQEIEDIHLMEMDIAKAELAYGPSLLNHKSELVQKMIAPLRHLRSRPHKEKFNGRFDCATQTQIDFANRLKPNQEFLDKKRLEN